MQHARALALDLALLLPAGPAAEARRISRILARRSGDATIALGTRACLPHVTLAMAPVPEGRMEEAAAVLASVVGRRLPLALVLTGISTVETARGRLVSGFDVALGPGLLALHREAADALAALAADEDPALCTGEGAAPDPSMVGYVRDFLRTSAYARYSPHVTLGVGEAADADAAVAFPHRFEVGAAALCHVGNGGTCRRVLAEIQI